MRIFQHFFYLVTLSLILLSCDSDSTSNSNNNVIFGVYEADWMPIRFYLYPDSTFCKVDGETDISRSEFESDPKVNITYNLTNPETFGTYTILIEGEDTIISCKYKRWRGWDNPSWISRFKMENNNSFFTINENRVRETYNKVAGLDELK